MTLLCIALCFVSALVGGVIGMKALFWASRPQAVVTITLCLNEEPKCSGCGKAIGVRTLFRRTDKYALSLDGETAEKVQ